MLIFYIKMVTEISGFFLKSGNNEIDYIFLVLQSR